MLNIMESKTAILIYVNTFFPAGKISRKKPLLTFPPKPTHYADNRRINKSHFGIQLIQIDT